MITLISASKRVNDCFNMLDNAYKLMPNTLNESIILVAGNEELHNQYKEKIQKNFKNCKIICAKEDFYFRKGFDTGYNLLNKAANNKFILALCDSDVLTVNENKLIEDLNEDLDYYLGEIFMERGEATEKKYLLYKKESSNWYGLVHENLQLKPDSKGKEITSFSIKHLNAKDKFSKNLKKTDDGFIILERPDVDSDSYQRNLIYEYLAYLIANKNGRHLFQGWFKRHYEINKELIDEYYNIAKEKYNL